MDISQFFTLIFTFLSLILLYLTIENTKQINRTNLFGDLVRQERELRVKLFEFKERIRNKQGSTKEVSLSYDTLLFNFYEFLAISLYKKLVNEKETKLYFKTMFKDVVDLFDSSILFKENYAKKEDYKGIIWLKNKWKNN